MLLQWGSLPVLGILVVPPRHCFSGVLEVSGRSASFTASVGTIPVLVVSRRVASVGYCPGSSGIIQLRRCLSGGTVQIPVVSYHFSRCFSGGTVPIPVVSGRNKGGPRNAPRPLPLARGQPEQLTQLGRAGREGRREGGEVGSFMRQGMALGSSSSAAGHGRMAMDHGDNHVVWPPTTTTPEGCY